MQKIRILDDAPAGKPLHAHLEPIVDFLIAGGNKFAHPYRWGSSREGYFCHLKEPINFSDIVGHFDLPETIVLGIDRNVIYCRNTGCTIQTKSDDVAPTVREAKL